jgi:NADPH2:quinone reductase
MKAILCTEWGGPEKLIVGDAPSLSAGPGEVVIDMRAAGVNFADTVIIQGTYQLKPDFPFTPGLEVAGVVAQLGDGVDSVSVGDRVVGIPNIGAFAEQVVVKAAAVVPIPDDMDFEAAASFAVAYSTSHMALDYRAGLKKGETLLVFGAAGGVGLTAVELGNIMGAKVIACASTQEKLDLCSKRGAEHVINYTEEDIRERVKEITGGKGADVIYDPVGGKAFDAAMRAINWEGRIVVIGFASGDFNQVRTNIMMVKNIAVMGFYWGSYSIHRPSAIGDSMSALIQMWKERKITPHISHSMPLDRAGEALAMMIGRKSTGKMVLTVGD